MAEYLNFRYWALKAVKSIAGTRPRVSISSGELAKYMGISQQSASRMILDLLKEGLITRQMNGRRQEIEITPRGMEILLREYADLGVLLEKQVSMNLSGTVQSGLGEGRYYISRKFYVIQFQEKLGYVPYLGTLNVKIDQSSELSLRKLRSMDGIHIDGFITEDRTYGPVKCFRGKISGIQCAVIFPERSVYSDVMEIISPVYLRERLSLVDGQKITVEIDGPFN
ncbi:MAG: DUF120 domain-containing protein [Candidatus Thermoplasmatota archaeon]|nr:DUF120 domain-containing protein [Candidatus Thermoplasmatota archaeon]